MDDWMLHARNLIELEQKLETFLQFAASKNLKLKTKKYIVVSEVEFEESILTEVNKQLLKRPKISLTQNFLDIKFFEPKFFFIQTFIWIQKCFWHFKFS